MSGLAVGLQNRIHWFDSNNRLWILKIAGLVQWLVCLPSKQDMRVRFPYPAQNLTVAVCELLRMIKIFLPWNRKESPNFLNKTHDINSQLFLPP